MFHYNRTIKATIEARIAYIRVLKEEIIYSDFGKNHTESFVRCNRRIRIVGVEVFIVVLYTAMKNTTGLV